MLFSQRMLILFSPVQLFAMLSTFFIIIAALGMTVTRKFIPNARSKVHNDVAGPIFGVIGTIYAVMLAFVVVITWEGHETTKQHIDSEVGGLVSLFVNAEGFRQPMKDETRNLILDYTDSIATKEWKDLKMGKGDPVTATLLFKLMKTYAAYEPATKSEEMCLEKSVGKISELIELRRRRQLDSRDGIHPMLWITLIAGGALTIFVGCLFWTESLNLHFIVTIALALLIALLLFTIVELDFPFTGKMGMSPAAFEEIVVRLRPYMV